MSAKSVSHVVQRPGRKHGDPDVQIPVAEDLVTVPGTRRREDDISFYNRVYPEETQNIMKAADREWVWTVYTDEMVNYRKYHGQVNEKLIDAAEVSAQRQPVGTPTGEDVTEKIRLKAREMGFGEVGFTKFDKRFTYTRKRRWVKFPHAICLALEQDYWQTQTLPSMDA